tara:strand:+ start:90250 stop:90774 length:525 start_codon:yes stop_codon:yes gene_type:complete
LGLLKFFLVALFVFLISNEIQEETILWEKQKRLSWSDFKGKPQNNRAAAVTASGLTYRIATTKENNKVVAVDFEVNSFFYPQKSWFRPALCDQVILSHEQLHFDITEVYAEILRKRFAKALQTHKSQAEMKAIYQQVNRELNDFQNVYDAETNFSRNREQQLLWNKKIEAILMD